MFSQSIIKVARPATKFALQSRATFTTSTRVMASGDTGAPPKTGGQGDAFHKREKANEDWAIRQREQEKLKELKAKLEQHQKHLAELSKSIDDMSKEQGGEQK